MSLRKSYLCLRHCSTAALFIRFADAIASDKTLTKQGVSGVASRHESSLLPDKFIWVE